MRPHRLLPLTPWTAGSTLVFCLAIVLTALISPLGAGAATVWSGPAIDFVKPDFGDPNDAANRDVILPGVVEITRGNSSGLYNHAAEAGYAIDFSPADTEWAFLNNNPVETVEAANFMNLSFADWKTAHGGNPLGTIGHPAVLHIVSADIYIDLTFTSFTSGGAGGGFAYTRSTVPEPATGLLLACALAALGLHRRARSA